MDAKADEEKILRTWTPFLLRTILIAATLILIFGLIYTGIREPAYYVSRYRLVQGGTATRPAEDFIELVNGSLSGDAHSMLTLGLLVLTLVPLGRVAFTLILFIRERDVVYIAATAYVLTALIAGMMLGRIG
ncbi:MAG TPA: DUF1634 domain-containing protein [Candidatus Binataceae bacterium]|nr:DUF1634 domain-containing protein [Candidatus Binataceae bacterium]